MRVNSKKVDTLFKKAECYFPPFKYPFVWHKIQGENMADWANLELDCLDTPIHYVGLNFSLHGDNADLFDSIVHEYIHAWQFENGLEIDHGIEFCKWVVKLASQGINAASNECGTDDLEKAHNWILEQWQAYQSKRG